MLPAQFSSSSRSPSKKRDSFSLPEPTWITLTSNTTVFNILHSRPSVFHQDSGVLPGCPSAEAAEQLIQTVYMHTLSMLRVKSIYKTDRQAKKKKTSVPTSSHRRPVKALALALNVNCQVTSKNFQVISTCQKQFVCHMWLKQLHLLCSPSYLRWKMMSIH